MNLRMSVFAAAILAGCGLANAQTLHIPQFYVQAPERPLFLPNHENQFVNTELIDVWLIGATWFDNATLSADKLVDQILADLSTPSVLQGNSTGPQVAITLQAFAHQNRSTSARTDAPNTRFLDNDDNLPGLIPAAFPSFSITADPALHPWQYHSYPRLALWMKAFCAEYKARQAADPRIPDPVQFHFDSEFDLAPGSDLNTMFMLGRISHDSGWSTNQVPGFPAGTTMASLYAAAVTAYSFPPDINDTTAGIDATRDSAWNRNPPFFLWYHNICNVVRNYVLDQGAYSIIKSSAFGWPACTCGNYGDAQTDNTSDITGWFIDNSTGLESNNFPRCQIDLSGSGALMWSEVSGRYFDPYGHASGDFSTPYLYPFFFDTVSANAHSLGQKNLYRLHPADLGHPTPYHPDEDFWDAALRTSRLWLESAINTPAPTLNTPVSVVPWLPLMHENTGCDNWYCRIEEPQLRQLMSLFRAKNLAEGLFLSSGGVSVAGTAWMDTAELVQRVYAPRLYNYSVTTGTLLSPGTDHDVSRLDFTLRDATGSDRTVNIGAENVDGKYVTEMQVKFTLPVGPQIQYGQAHDYTTQGPGVNGYTYEINIECKTNVAATTGAVYVWNFGSGAWALALLEDGTSMPYTTDRPDRSARRSFTIGANSSADSFVSGGQMLLKLVHANLVPFTSLYDLVQVIPVRIRAQPICCGSLSALQADVNYDGVSDELDLARFLDKWIASHPGADANMDGVVDEADLGVFMENLSLESP